MKLSKLLVLLMALAMLLAFTACSDDDDDDDTVGPGPSTSEDFQVNATSYNNSVYFSFETGDTVTVSDPATSNDWHMAFQRYAIKLNGGSSGELGVKAVDLEELGTEFGMDYEGLTSLPDISEDDWGSDEINYVFDGWYNYNPSNHEVTPTGRVFPVRTADGDHYAKIEVTAIRVAGRGMIGGVDVKFVYQTEGRDLSGEAVTVSMDDEDSDNSIFFSFASGGQVDIVDPANSSDWDIWFDGFDVKINGGASGPGEAGLYPMYLEEPDMLFEDITSAPMDMGASYESDMATSPLTSWYDYNGQTHEILSKGHVYILQIDESTHYKFEITNYYKVVEGSPVSGWISFNYQEL